MLKYFPSFSNYNFGSTGGVKDVKNLFKFISIQIDDPESVKIEKIYPEERPEQLSDRLYGTFDYYWILMILNGIKNPFEWNKILGQQSTYEDLERYDSMVLQFSNSSPFLPTAAEAGVTYNGSKYYLYADGDIDSYDGVEFNSIQPNDIIIFKKGLSDYAINCVGAGGVTAGTTPAIQSLYTLGKLKSWYHYGQCVVPENFNVQKNVVQITAGRHFTCALDDRGYIYCWGDTNLLNYFSGFNKFNTLYKSGNGGYTFIEASQDKLVAINRNYTLEFFGQDVSSEISLYAAAGGPTGSKTSWYHVTDAGSTGGVVVTKNGTVRDINNTLPPTGTTLSDVACGSQFCIGLLGNGSLTGWGANNYQQLSGIPGGTGFIKISATYNHALALKSNGTVYAWGLSSDGQCNVPNKTFVDVAAGRRHSAALTNSNELCAWGKIPRAGFTGTGVTGTTYSAYTLNNYTIYGNYDQIYCGDHHIVLRGMTGTEKTFVGIVTTIDNDYKRIICKVSSGDLIQDELFLSDPTGTVVSVWRAGSQIRTINNKLIGIQKYKNATQSIISGDTTIPITKDIWKSVYIVYYSTPEKDSRLQTLQKIYDSYNMLIKQDIYYPSRDVMQSIDLKVFEDLKSNLTELNYNISSF